MRFLLTVISDRGEATLQDAVDALRGRLANSARRHGADLVRTLDVERRFEIPLTARASVGGSASCYERQDLTRPRLK